MARHTTLAQMVTMLREETGQSSSAALGQNTLPALKAMLRRMQSVLWEDHPWPHMRVERDFTIQAGARYYNYPPDLSSHHRIESMAVKNNGEWQTVKYGIEPENYNAIDPETNTREDPIRRWKFYEDEQLEVWPLPATDGYQVRCKGIKVLSPLIADEDRADLDDNMIVLYCAAEIAATRKQQNAQNKLSIAQRHFARLKGSQSKTNVFVLGGGSDPNDHVYRRPYPMYGKRV